MPYEIIINRELCESIAECVAIILDAARAITLIDHYGDQAWP
jgi:hypothetical protein